MSRFSFALLPLVLAAVPVADSAAQSRSSRADSAFSWSAKIPAGSWLRVHSAKGAIRVLPGDGETAEVRADEVWGSRTREPLMYEVSKDGSSVTICAVTSRSRCDEDGISTNGDDSHYASARFTVRLPKGVKLSARSGNGEISIQDAGAEVIASSGNGDLRIDGVDGKVRASTGNGDVVADRVKGRVDASSGNGRVLVSTSNGPVNASSGNGDIDVQMDSLTGDEDMRFSTGNGRIVLSLPRDFEGEIDSRTGSGRIRTDFPIALRGELSPTRLRGTIGRGGRRIVLSSGNGSLELRKLN